MHIIVHTDGGARGNPGPAAIGVVVEEMKEERRILKKFGMRIGETTNNVAEYRGVVEALKYLKSQVAHFNSLSKQNVVHFYLDSNLVVQQLNGLFKVKDAKLREFLAQIRILEQEIGWNMHYHLVPREQNTHADVLVNEALDS